MPSAQTRGSSPRKQIWVLKSRGQEKGLAAGACVSVQKASAQKKVIEPGGHARVQQLENLHHVSRKREVSSAELVTSQNLPKSLGGNGSQPRHSHNLSNWQKKQLHKLSAEKLRERCMAWVPKGNLQVQNEIDVKVEVEAKNEKGVRRCAPNQQFASNHQNLFRSYFVRVEKQYCKFATKGSTTNIVMDETVHHLEMSWLGCGRYQRGRGIALLGKRLLKTLNGKYLKIYYYDTKLDCLRTDYRFERTTVDGLITDTVVEYRFVRMIVDGLRTDTMCGVSF
uniref:Uncharacterized protein n=1 Tax=Oryza meridionalis TaxID=40149 RepID=A0A0E0FC16_9ORYZ